MMNENIKSWFETHKEEVANLKKTFWENPETAFTEYVAAETTREFLLNHGFTEVNAFDAEEKGGKPNTVIAKWGSGKPVIGLLGELDALPGLGQDAVPYYSPKEGPGHGCGHCLMATAGVTSAVALREAMEKENIPGTLVYIACPAEETLAGKAVLARDGYFDDLDIGLIWHPSGSDMDFSTGMVMSATTNILFEFQGKTAHGGTAWQGRSALDAAELMNVGVQVPIGNKWSVGADYYYPWAFRKDDHKNCFQLLGLNMEGRYWFGANRGLHNRLKGHSVGVTIGGGYFDFEKNFKGDQGEYLLIGADYLYAMPVFKGKLHLEFSLGLGYIYSSMRPYEVFEPG